MSGGRVDVLVNNAGVYFPMSLDEGPNKGQGPLDGAVKLSLSITSGEQEHLGFKLLPRGSSYYLISLTINFMNYTEAWLLSILLGEPSASLSLCKGLLHCMRHMHGTWGILSTSAGGRHNKCLSRHQSDSPLSVSYMLDVSVARSMLELVTTHRLIAGSPDDWDKQTQINLMTPMRLTRMLLPGMKDKGQE